MKKISQSQTTLGKAKGERRKFRELMRAGAKWASDELNPKVVDINK